MRLTHNIILAADGTSCTWPLALILTLSLASHVLLLFSLSHYNAYALNHSNGRWYLHDDASVSRVSHVSDIKSSSAYVLFYRRRKAGEPTPKSEEEQQADMKEWEDAQPKKDYSAYSAYASSYSSSSSSSSSSYRPSTWPSSILELD